MKNQSIAAPGTQASCTLIRAVHDELRLVREPGRAAGQHRYMKSSMPFMGVRVPVMRKTAQAVFDRYRSAGRPSHPIGSTSGSVIPADRRDPSLRCALPLAGVHIRLREPVILIQPNTNDFRSSDHREQRLRAASQASTLRQPTFVSDDPNIGAHHFDDGANICLMRRISLIRFDALAGYARQPLARVQAEEVSWFELASGDVVGTVIRDRTDNDYGGVVFARDAKLKFRSVNVTEFKPSIRRAEVALRRAMEKAALAPPEDHHQGDETGGAVDFFDFTRKAEQLSPDFVQLATLEAYSPARHIIEVMMRWYEDADGNFIEQFQTTGFDQRIWETLSLCGLHGDGLPTRS